MSSSSTTACSRSPSPSPTTPEASDILEPIMSQEDLSAWCKSLPNAEFLISSQLQFGEHARKAEDRPTLNLEDLLQDHVYQDVTPAALNVSAESLFCPVTSPSSPISSTLGGVICGRTSITSIKPVPPPAQVRKDPPALQRVVFPEKDACSNLPIMFPSLPDGGTKSRVETQIRLTVDLAHASSSVEPSKYDKVGSWKWLRLPKGTTTKKRTRKEGKVDAPAEESLYLTAEITCATPPHTRVTVCSSCQTREAKRVARKIAARVRPARSDSESQEEPRIIPGKGKHEDTSNILQFNCPEVLDFSSGTVILPLRITCYCRHHREKVGFNLHLTMLDHAGRVVGTGSTKPIMITDDHKSTGVNTQKASSEFGAKLDWTVAGTDSQDSAPKRKKAPNSTDRSKKRAKPYDTNTRLSKLHRQSSSGSLHSPSELTSAFVTRASSPLQAGHSVSSLQIDSSVTSSPPPSFSFGEAASSSAAVPTAVLNSNTSTALAGSQLTAFDSNASIADFINTNFNVDVVMPDCSELESPAPSFQDPSTSPFLPSSQASMQMSQSVVEPLNLAVPVPAPAIHMPYMMFKHDPPPPITLPQPRIHRLIPAAGPTFGGIEVTVLGANFHPSLQLNCVFGATPSTSTQRWSDNTLVCILPPSVAPGQVHVWFEGLPKEDDGTPPCLFTYTDETDRALMELALQVVGLKMTGKIEDARHIAMRIVGNTGGPEPDNSNSMSSNMSAGGAIQLSSHMLLGRAGENGDFEKVLLDFLSVLNIPMDGHSAASGSFISKQTTSGQTLLHLATLAKFPSLVRFLLSQDIDMDARDQNGCTALFLAALTNSVECAKVLVLAGAALDVVNAAGKTPAEVGPIGFFDSITSESERSSEGGDQDEDEGAWGDIEEESDSDLELRSTIRRRTVCRNSHRHLKPHSNSTPEDTIAAEVDSKSLPSSAEKKAVEAGLAVADEKQVAATFTETLYRTLAQLQHPQGMIANIPGIPLLHMPNLPGMPAWGALPQIPAVFPVLVPIQQLWSGRGVDEKDDRAEGAAEASGQQQQPQQQVRLGIPSAQDWKAFWEKWMQQATRETETDNPPPAYTPRERTTDCTFDADPDTKEQLSVSSGQTAGRRLEDQHELEPEQCAGGGSSGSGMERTARPVGYVDAAVPEEEVQSYDYRPARKIARRAKKKHDRMLVLFWIPILIFGFAWALLHTLKIALHATKALVLFKVGLHA